MKKIYCLLLVIVLAVSAANAQITITRANMPVAGEQFIFSTTNDQIDIKPTGANHNWDFSKLQPGLNDTFIFKRPADISMLYAFAFTGSVALKQPGGLGGGQGDAYQFFKASSTTYSQVGLGINVIASDLPIKYNDEDEVYNFPLNFRRKDSSTFAGKQDIPGIGKIVIKGIRITEVDGWGTITTPYKTYNCLRVRSFVREIDSLAGQGFMTDRVEFKWLALEEKVPVLQVIGTVVNGQFMQQSVMYRDIYRSNVNPNAPVADFMVKDSVVFVKDTVPFANLSTGNMNQYNWTFTPNTVTFIAGTNQNSPNPVVTFNAAGKYTVTLSAVNRDGKDQRTKTNYIDVRAKNSSVNEEEYQLNAFTVFPNPTNNGITQIQLSGKMKNEKVLVEVLDMQGRNLTGFTKINNMLPFELDMRNQPKGLYMLRISGSAESFTKKLIIE